MTKNEIIKKLYDEGKITLDEVIVLAQTDGPVADSGNFIGTPIRSSKSELDRVADELLSGVVEGWDDEQDPNIHYAFDVEKIIRFMEENDWKWADGLNEDYTYTESPVTYDRFVKELANMIKDSARQTLEKYHNGDMEDDAEGGSATGGLRVRTWIDPNYDGRKQIVVSVEFIAEEIETGTPID